VATALRRAVWFGVASSEQKRGPDRDNASEHLQYGAHYAQVVSALCSVHSAHSRVPDAIMEAVSYIYGGLLIVGGLMGGLKVRAPLCTGS
jgi:hypothetical protein